jgi:hypothetical protein
MLRICGRGCDKSSIFAQLDVVIGSTLGNGRAVFLKPPAPSAVLHISFGLKQKTPALDRMGKGSPFAREHLLVFGQDLRNKVVAFGAHERMIAHTRRARRSAQRNLVFKAEEKFFMGGICALIVC